MISHEIKYSKRINEMSGSIQRYYLSSSSSQTTTGWANSNQKQFNHLQYLERLSPNNSKWPEELTYCGLAERGPLGAAQFNLKLHATFSATTFTIFCFIKCSISSFVRWSKRALLVTHYLFLLLELAAKETHNVASRDLLQLARELCWGSAEYDCVINFHCELTNMAKFPPQQAFSHLIRTQAHQWSLYYRSSSSNKFQVHNMLLQWTILIERCSKTLPAQSLTQPRRMATSCGSPGQPKCMFAMARRKKLCHHDSIPLLLLL